MFKLISSQLRTLGLLQSGCVAKISAKRRDTSVHLTTRVNGPRGRAPNRRKRPIGTAPVCGHACSLTGLLIAHRNVRRCRV